MNVVLVLHIFNGDLFFVSERNNRVGMVWKRTEFESIAPIALMLARDDFYLKNKTDFIDGEGNKNTIFTFLKHS